MQYIIDFFEFLEELILYVLCFLNETLLTLIDFFGLLIKSVNAMPNVFSIFPQEIKLLLVGLFSVVVIYKVLGRE